MYTTAYCLFDAVLPSIQNLPFLSVCTTGLTKFYPYTLWLVPMILDDAFLFFVSYRKLNRYWGYLLTLSSKLTALVLKTHPTGILILSV